MLFDFLPHRFWIPWSIWILSLAKIHHQIIKFWGPRASCLQRWLAKKRVLCGAVTPWSKNKTPKKDLLRFFISISHGFLYPNLWVIEYTAYPTDKAIVFHFWSKSIDLPVSETGCQWHPNTLAALVRRMCTCRNWLKSKVLQPTEFTIANYFLLCLHDVVWFVRFEPFLLDKHWFINSRQLLSYQKWGTPESSPVGCHCDRPRADRGSSCDLTGIIVWVTLSQSNFMSYYFKLYSAISFYHMYYIMG